MAKKEINSSGALIIFYVMGIYIFASFIWWTYLMLGYNQDRYESSIAQVEMEYQNDGVIIENFENSPAYESLTDRHKRQRLMILGEASVFLILLTIGFLKIRQYFQQEIQLANQQKNFMLSITHELKSPLASMKLSLETLLKRSLTNEQQEKIFKGSLEDVSRLEELVENILLAAKIESVNYKFDTIDINLSQLLVARVDMLSDKFEEIEIMKSISADVQIIGDKVALTSVIVNLIENAIKYSGGKQDVDVSLVKAGDKAKLIVADQGKGIPEAERKNIFKKFYRIGNEETRSAKGTGLGLYIVDKVIKEHHGSIEIENNSPKGSKFIVYLPVKS